VTPLRGGLRERREEGPVIAAATTSPGNAVIVPAAPSGTRRATTERYFRWDSMAWK